MQNLGALKNNIYKYDIGFPKIRNYGKWKKNTTDSSSEESVRKAATKFRSHPRILGDSTSSTSLSSDDSQMSFDYDFADDYCLVKDERPPVVKLRETLESKSPNNIKQNHKSIVTNEKRPEKTNTDKVNIEKYIEDCAARKKKHIKTSKVSKTTKKFKSEIILKKKEKKSKMSTHKLKPKQTFDMIDSEFNRKFHSLVEKSVNTMTDIRLIIDEGIDPPDGEEDLARRTNRVKGFCSIFVRNYLYPLKKRIVDFTEEPKSVNQNINTKLISFYNLITHGLVSYHNHLPSSCGTCASEKLTELLKFVIEVCIIHADYIPKCDFNAQKDYIYGLRVNADALLIHLNEAFNAKSSITLLKSQPTKSSLSKPNTIKGVAKKPKNMPSRFSMYNSSTYFRKDLTLKRQMDLLNKKKVNVKSKYKTAMFKHRPLPEKEENPVKLFKTFSRRSSSIVRSTPVMTPHSDVLQTQISIDNAKQEKNLENRHENDDATTKLVRNDNNPGQESGAQKEPTPNQADWYNLLKNFLDKEEGKKILEQLAQEVKKTQENVEKPKSPKASSRGDAVATTSKNRLELKIVSSNSTIKSSRSARKEPSVTSITGAKNAKLICIKDENSILEDASDDEPPQHEPPSSKPSKSRIKIHRTTKNVRKLDLVPAETMINVMQYKLEFKKCSKNNPLYMKTSTLQPWLLMSKLSDEILDKIMLDVAGEIELCNIAEKVYQEELQI